MNRSKVRCCSTAYQPPNGASLTDEMCVRKGRINPLLARLFVRFADGRAGARQRISIQCDILTSVLFAVGLQPGHMLRPFNSGGCQIYIGLALFRRRLIQLGLFGQKPSQFQLLSRRQRCKLFFQQVELLVRHLFILRLIRNFYFRNNYRPFDRSSSFEKLIKNYSSSNPSQSAAIAR